MKVIGHDDETASEPMITRLAIKEKRNEAFENGVVVKDAVPAIYANCQEIGNVSVAVRPNSVKAAEPAGRSGIVGFIVCGDAG